MEFPSPIDDLGLFLVAVQCVIFDTEPDAMTLAPDDKPQDRHFDWSGVPIDLGGMEPLEQIARLLCHALVAPAAALTITEGGRLRVLAARGISSSHVKQAMELCQQVPPAPNGVTELIEHATLAQIQLGDAAFPACPRASSPACPWVRRRQEFPEPCA